jgi:hypothetical protein
MGFPFQMLAFCFAEDIVRFLRKILETLVYKKILKTFRFFCYIIGCVNVKGTCVLLVPNLCTVQVVCLLPETVRTRCFSDFRVVDLEIFAWNLQVEHP